jgi:hypothetical protein
MYITSEIINPTIDIATNVSVTTTSLDLKRIKNSTNPIFDPARSYSAGGAGLIIAA